MRLNDLLRRTARVEVTYAGETFGVDYRPHAITTDVQVRLSAMQAAAVDSEAAAVDALLELLPTLIEGWEVEDDDGRPLPVTPATLRCFPIVLLGEIAAAITAELADPTRTTNGTAPTRSSSGSSAAAASAPVPIGTA